MIIEWDFWANIAFFVGALVWLASPITCELTYMSSECHFVEFLASIAFLFCAILYLIYDWELGFFRRTDIYLAVYAGGLGNGGLEGLLEGTNWFTFNHMLFFSRHVHRGDLHNNWKLFYMGRLHQIVTRNLYIPRLDRSRLRHDSHGFFGSTRT